MISMSGSIRSSGSSPKSERFVLVQRIQDALLDMLGAIVMARKGCWRTWR